MKNDDGHVQESPQISIIDFLNKISNDRQNKKTVSNIIRIDSCRRKANSIGEKKDAIQCALNYANSLDW